MSKLPLETQTIHLTPVGKLNDVFEGLYFQTQEGINEYVDSVGDLAFIKSFSENACNLRMWGDYAD